jgi:hypothetical protein
VAWSTTPTIRPWIVDRIHQALHEAHMARAAAEDLADQVLVQATLRLAEALEAFAVSYADRLGEIDPPACDSSLEGGSGLPTGILASD